MSEAPLSIPSAGTQPWPFTKMQGLGNDFLILDLRDPADAAALNPRWPLGRAVLAAPLDMGVAALARGLCDRHVGIGADGVLLLLPSLLAAVRMRVVNADGSEAEMCGNGLRCVARYLWERAPFARTVDTVWIETGAGVLACALSMDSDDTAQVEVAMGRPRFLRQEIPVSVPTPGAELLGHPLTVGDRTFAVSAVSMGNPHAVIFLLPEETDLAALARRYGPLLEADPRFPQRTNVEFARFRGVGDVELWVWERGCGLTRACGTGACATAAAAWRLGMLPAEVPLTVWLPGGALRLRVAADGSEVYMRGPAEQVFTGLVDLPAV